MPTTHRKNPSTFSLHRLFRQGCLLLCLIFLPEMTQRKFMKLTFCHQLIWANCDDQPAEAFLKWWFSKTIPPQIPLIQVRNYTNLPRLIFVSFFLLVFLHPSPASFFFPESLDFHLESWLVNLPPPLSTVPPSEIRPY